MIENTDKAGKKKMRVGIDLRAFFTGSKYRGIGIYSKKLIEGLVHIQDDTTYHFLNLYGKYKEELKLNERCFLYEYDTGPQLNDADGRRLLTLDQTKSIVKAEVEHYLEQSRIDVMLFTSPNEFGNFFDAEWFAGVKKAAVIHDFIPFIFPDQYLSNEWYRSDYEKSIEFVKSMDLLLANSQFTKDDAEKRIGIQEDRIKVIYAGIDESFYKTGNHKTGNIDVTKLKRKYKIADSFLLFAGGIDFKKNIEKLILAFSHLPKTMLRKYQLVITGKASNEVIHSFMELAEKHNVSSKVICTGYVPEEDLIAMYHAAAVMVFPSLYEGFGLPVLEAMACKTPVVTSDVSSMKEIAQGYAVLIDPTSVKSIAKGILSVLQNQSEMKKMAEEAAEYAKSFTWKKTAHLAYEAISKLNCEKMRMQRYEFFVSEQDLYSIAQAFVANHILLTDYQKKSIADELVILEKHEPKRIKEFRKRILYDVTVLEKWMKAGYLTGIARASMELYKGLLGKTSVVPVVVRKAKHTAAIDEVDIDTWDRVQENIEITNHDIYLMPELQLRGVQVDREHPGHDIFKRNEIKCYAIIYDILPVRMPQFFETETSVSFVSYLQEILNEYDGILCDSRFVADDIISYYKGNGLQTDHEVKVGFYHLGSNSFRKKENESIRYFIRRFMYGSEPVFVMIGTIEPRKGHPMALQAFEQLWQKGFSGKLCFAGHIGWNMQTFINNLKIHPEKGKRLEFFESVNDTELEYVYRHADALIQASVGEGFGLPLIEAGKYKLPVICSDIEVFHEVAGDHAIYFEKDSANSLSEKIEQFLLLRKSGNVPHSAEIKSISWEKAADKVYDMICNQCNWYSRI